MLSSHSSIRWLSCKNTTSPAETIPGFALMRITGQEVVERQVVYQVARPDSTSEAGQDSALLLVNGPGPILPGKYGSGTQDFPVRVLHERSDAGSGSACGPRQGSWKAWRSGTAHAIIGSDPSGASVPAEDELLWITCAASDASVYDAAFRVSLAEIASGAAIAPLVDAYRDPPSAGLSRGIYALGNGLSFSHSGSYLVGFSLSLYSNTAPRGTQLAVRLYYDGVATEYAALRTQDIERDEYGANLLTTVENVCQAGPLQIAAGKTLEVRNESNYPIVVTPVTLWAALLFRHPV